MKILFAYDGSESADIAIDGLQRAGLPNENVEALVVSVGEVWLPPPDELAEDPAPSTFPPGLKEARQRAAQVMEEAEQLAQRGSKRVQQRFSNWQVRHEVRNGSPGFELLNCARRAFGGSHCRRLAWTYRAWQVCVGQRIAESFN